MIVCVWLFVSVCTFVSPVMSWCLVQGVAHFSPLFTANCLCFVLWEKKKHPINYFN